MSEQTDWGEVYAACVAAMIAVAEPLTPEQLTVPVPATPEWTVHQLLAHAAGGSADAVAGRMDGAPSPAWTSRHVAERAGASVTDLVEELRSTSDAVAEMSRGSERPAIVWDKSVHLADLHEALGLGIPPESTWLPVLAQLAPWRLAGLPLTVVSGDASYGAGGPAVTVAPYELFRSLFSRRSRAQLRAWAGDSVPEGDLDAVPLFGPRDDDQPVPG